MKRAPASGLVEEPLDQLGRDAAAAALRVDGDVHQVPDVVVAGADQVADQPLGVLGREADPRRLRELQDEHRQRPRRREGAPLDRDHRGQVAVAEPAQDQLARLIPRAVRDLCSSHLFASGGLRYRGWIWSGGASAAASPTAHTCRAATLCIGSSGGATVAPAASSSAANRSAPSPAARGLRSSSCTRSASSSGPSDERRPELRPAVVEQRRERLAPPGIEHRQRRLPRAVGSARCRAPGRSAMPTGASRQTARLRQRPRRRDPDPQAGERALARCRPRSARSVPSRRRPRRCARSRRGAPGSGAGARPGPGRPTPRARPRRHRSRPPRRRRLRCRHRGRTSIESGQAHGAQPIPGEGELHGREVQQVQSGRTANVERSPRCSS